MAADQRRSSGPESATGDALVAAAIRLIEAGGVSAATSRAIADEADANLGAITYYFGSKDALVAAALVEIARRLLAPVIEILTSSDSPLEQLQAASTLLPTILGDNPAALRGYVHALAAAVDDPAVRAALTALHRELTELLAAQIRTHQTGGVVPVWVRPHEMAATIIALVDGVAVTTAAQLSDASPIAVSTQFAALLMNDAGESGWLAGVTRA